MASSDILEQGDIYVVYRPRAEPDETPDVPWVYLVLHADNGRIRRLVLGRQRPAEPQSRGRLWGFVDEVSSRPGAVGADLQQHSYPTATRGRRTLPEAQPAGEGRYALVRHRDHNHLAYRLELPQRSGEAQQELALAPEASYVVAVKHPQEPSPSGVGLAPPQPPELPEIVLDRFRGRRFAEADPELLDHENIEFVLLDAAAEEAAAELGIELDAESEPDQSAEIFQRFRMPLDAPAEPLPEGGRG